MGNSQNGVEKEKMIFKMIRCDVLTHVMTSPEPSVHLR
jgi:hypothetical protein